MGCESPCPGHCDSLTDGMVCLLVPLEEASGNWAGGGGVDFLMLEGLEDWA